jgi:hypothetical protein
MRKRFYVVYLSVLLVASLVFVTPAQADHTNPREPQSERTAPTDNNGETFGEGTWEHIRNFPPNPGTDLFFFKKARRLWASAGTLGQANEQNVGQRILKLIGPKGNVRPRWRADHASANCVTQNPRGTTGLQHDVTVIPKRNPQLLFDTTDATGRCHDGTGGGLEIVDISKIHKKKFQPREIHLTRHLGTSHTVTRDDKRPWIVYNNNANFNTSTEDRDWIEALDMRSCLGLGKLSLKEKRKACRPKVYRIPFEPEWSEQLDNQTGDGEDTKEGSSAACHDITSRGYRLYCASLNATLIFSVKDMVKPSGAIKGTPLPCTVVAAEPTADASTGAKVTDCMATDPLAEENVDNPLPAAKGWKFLGTVHHPGRDNGTGGTDGNSNFVVPSNQGVSISHEADPVFGGKYMLVTDERGGGIIPGSAACSPGVDNPYGNGGLHVFDITDPSNPVYAETPDGERAIYIGQPQVPAPTFCTMHVIEQIPGEQRLAVAYYSQGTKIIDYAVDDNGKWTFRETASIVFPGAQTWASQPFKIKKNSDGTKTYYFMSSDIGRGIDIFSWTGPPNPIGTKSFPTGAAGTAPVNLGLLFAGAAVLPLAWGFGRRRRRKARSAA